MKASSRNCPVCGCKADGMEVFLSENIDIKKISGFSYSSRKSPEYMCHRMVRCHQCDLVFATTPPEESVLAEAYHSAEYDSTEEAEDAALAYSKAIEPALKNLQQRDRALEIGAGTGIFLEHLKQRGFNSVCGVEPSETAIQAAPVERRAWIKMGMFDEADFQPNSFDLICCFMTMEHVRHPELLAESVLKLLKPGGVFVTVTHDYRSPINRLLGRRSPIVNIEHLQIFSKQSIRELFLRTGFESVEARSFINRYTLRYWLRLSPTPSFLRPLLERILSRTTFRNLRIGINVGNTIAYGYRSKERRNPTSPINAA